LDNLKFERVNLSFLSPQKQLASILSSNSLHSQNTAANLLYKQIEDANREAERKRIEDSLRIETERKKQEVETLRVKLEIQRKAETTRMQNEMRIEEEKKTTRS
jgi:hypothetical protein